MTIQEIQKVQALAITAISEINWRENNKWPNDYQSIESTQYLDGSIVIEYVTRVDIEHEKHGNGSPLTMVTDFYNINVPLTKSVNVNFKELYDLVEKAMEHIREVEITERIK